MSALICCADFGFVGGLYNRSAIRDGESASGLSLDFASMYIMSAPYNSTRSRFSRASRTFPSTRTDTGMWHSVSARMTRASPNALTW